MDKITKHTQKNTHTTGSATDEEVKHGIEPNRRTAYVESTRTFYLHFFS